MCVYTYTHILYIYIIFGNLALYKWCLVYIANFGCFIQLFSWQVNINATETLLVTGDVTLPFDKVVCEETYFHGKQFLGGLGPD